VRILVIPKRGRSPGTRILYAGSARTSPGRDLETAKVMAAPGASPDRRLARPMGLEPDRRSTAATGPVFALRPRCYRARPLRATMYRWEGTRLPFVLLCRGTWRKYAGWSVRLLNGSGRARTPISGRPPGRTGPVSANAY